MAAVLLWHFGLRLFCSLCCVLFCSVAVSCPLQVLYGSKLFMLCLCIYGCGAFDLVLCFYTYIEENACRTHTLTKLKGLYETIAVMGVIFIFI